MDTSHPPDTDDANYADRVNGQMYTRFIKNFHDVMKPRTYLEIGTQSGNTLAIATCPSIAVDPRFQINVNVAGGKSTCFLFQTTSDDFFRDYNPTAFLGAPVEFAFLDGLHKFEFLLRDFMNTEKFVGKNSVVMMHDCVPPGFYMTTREMADPIRLEKSAFGSWWTGDVFKLIPVLKRYRPDLKITILDCVPTGIVMITGLNPMNDVLRRAYDDIMRETSLQLDRAQFEAYWADLSVEKSETLMSREQLMRVISP